MILIHIRKLHRKGEINHKLKLLHHTTFDITPHIHYHDAANLSPLYTSWRRHQMEAFPALLAICAGNSPVPGEFPTQRPETRSFDVFFDLRPIKRLSKHWWCWWFETPSCPLWRHGNVHTRTLCWKFSSAPYLLFNKNSDRKRLPWLQSIYEHYVFWKKYNPASHLCISTKTYIRSNL